MFLPIKLRLVHDHSSSGLSFLIRDGGVRIQNVCGDGPWGSRIVDALEEGRESGNSQGARVVSWVGQRFTLSERKGGRKPRVEKGPQMSAGCREPRGWGGSGMGGGCSLPRRGVARGRGLRSQGQGIPEGPGARFWAARRLRPYLK